MEIDLPIQKKKKPFKDRRIKIFPQTRINSLKRITENIVFTEQDAIKKKILKELLDIKA